MLDPASTSDEVNNDFGAPERFLPGDKRFPEARRPIRHYHKSWEVGRSLLQEFTLKTGKHREQKPPTVLSVHVTGADAFVLVAEWGFCLGVLIEKYVVKIMDHAKG